MPYTPQQKMVTANEATMNNRLRMEDVTVV